MTVLNLRQGRHTEDIKEALNLLILVCRDNEELKHYESSLLEMEYKVNEGEGRENDSQYSKHVSTRDPGNDQGSQ